MTSCNKNLIIILLTNKFYYFGDSLIIPRVMTPTGASRLLTELRPSCLVLANAI